MDEVSFGEWLKRRRNGRGITQEQLAQQIGCAAITLRKIESEERRPSEQIVKRLSVIFDLPQKEQTAFLRFARGDLHSAPTAEAVDAPWRTSHPHVRSSLPARLNKLIGREQDIDRLRQYLADAGTRLVTLTGPPGIGKTSLSQQVAADSMDDFSNGIFFIALAPLDDPKLVAATISQTLRFEGRGKSSDIDLLKDGIADKQMLLVLDNFEHLLEATPIVPELLIACPHLKILVTSREALRVPGEWIYPVSPLTVPQPSQAKEIGLTAGHDFSALSLFAERARGAHPDFKLNPENADVIAAICARLDGLPLAIELIAARIRLMSPKELLSRMDDQFTLYADGMRGTQARQKTLHNSIAWSYDLLTIGEQAFFSQLGVFAGSFTLEAAAQVTGNTEALRSITTLLEKSLLQRDLREQEQTRFTMLFTIREFALHRLDKMNETAKMRNQHLEYFMELAKQADREIHGPHQVEWLDRLETEHDNYRSALDWCITGGRIESALYLIATFSGLGRFWSVRNYLSEARNWFDKVCTFPDVTLHAITYARALSGMSFIAALQSDSRSAIAMAEESRRICKSLGPDGELALADALLAGGLAAVWFGGDVSQAEVAYEQAASIYQAHGTPWERAFALLRLGVVACRRKNYQKSMLFFGESLGIFSKLDNAFGLARVYGEMSYLYLSQGDYGRARRMAQQALYYDKKLRFQHAVSGSLISLGTYARIEGEYEQAEAFLEEAASTRYEFNLLDENSRFYLGCVKLHGRDFAQARLCFIEHLKINQKYDLRINVGDGLIGLGAVAAGLLQYERSARLAGAGKALQDDFSYVMPPVDLWEIDPLMQIAHEQLGDTQFEALAAEGRAMTMEQAVAYALQE